MIKLETPPQLSDTYINKSGMSSSYMLLEDAHIKDKVDTMDAKVDR